MKKFRTGGNTCGAKKSPFGVKYNQLFILYEQLSKQESDALTEIVILPVYFTSVLNNESNSKSDPTLLVLNLTNYPLLFYIQRDCPPSTPAEIFRLKCL